MLFRAFAVFVYLASTLGGADRADALETIRVGGTGMGLALTEKLGAAFTGRTPDVRVDVLPSMGSTGGMRALTDGVIDIGLSARPLTDTETANGLMPAACMVTPLLFATSRTNPEGVSIDDLPEIFGNPAITWPDGIPLKVILRARSGSEHPYLASRVPGLADAFEAAFKRHGVAIGKTDQENAILAERIDGSFAIMTLLQVRAEALPLNIVPVDGIVPSATDADDGRYPFPIRLCAVRGPDTSPAAQRFLDFLGSDAAAEVIVRNGAVVAN